MEGGNPPLGYPWYTMIPSGRKTGTWYRDEEKGQEYRFLEVWIPKKRTIRIHSRGVTHFAYSSPVREIACRFLHALGKVRTG